MSEITFTRTLNLKDSTAVDEAFYNDNTGDLYVDLDPGEVYKYSDVPASVVAEFEKAPSVGSFYATRIKRDFGPSVSLGKWTYLDYNEVDVNRAETVVGNSAVVTVGNSTYGATTYGTLGVNTNTANPTPAFSLKPFDEPSVKVEGTEREYIVTFEVEGIIDFKRHTLRSKSVDEAVTSVLDLGKMLDLNFVVREVTIRFE